MARKYSVGKGIDAYISSLERSEKVTRAAIGMAIYDGAKIVADAIHEEIEKLPDNTPRLRKQKEGLLDGLGVTHIRDENGVRNVKIGFDGYNDVITPTYPKGQPNSMLARSLVSGTSFAPKNDFIGRAIRKSKAAAETAMKLRIDEKIYS